MSIGWDTGGASSPPSGPAGGDLGGAYPDLIVVEGLQGSPVSATAPTDAGQVLQWDGAQWTPTANNFTFIDEGSRTNPLTTATAPGAAPYPGASTYLSVGSAGSPIVLEPGKYAFWAGYIVSVDANGTEFWIDTFVNGSPSTAGPSSQPVGKAGSQANSTFTITVDIPVTTPLWFDIKVAKAGGPGNVTYVNAYVILVRLS